MTDDKANSGRTDRDRINLQQEYEVRDWSESLGVTTERLRQTVQIVGNNAATVREYLRSRRGA
jgi:hypothetical protein